MPKIVAIMSNKGGVGKTTLSYHIGHVLAETQKVLLADFDQQCNLSEYFFDDISLNKVWSNTDEMLPVNQNLDLLTLGSRLIDLEDTFAAAWRRSLGGDREAQKELSFWGDRLGRLDYDLVILDLGPNLGPLNRACLLFSDYLVVPLAADRFSVTGLQRLGGRMSTWKQSWNSLTPHRSSRTRMIGTVINKVQNNSFGDIIRAHQIAIRPLDQLVLDAFEMADHEIGRVTNAFGLVQKSINERKPVWNVADKYQHERPNAQRFRQEIEAISSGILARIER